MGAATLIDEAALGPLVPVPSHDANKYSRGKLVIVGGSAEYPGAVCLGALASQRIGAGYTEVLAAPESVPVVHGFRPSVVARPWDALDVDAINRAAAHHPVAVAIGSGMTGTSAQERELVLEVLSQVEAPVLADGGALTVTASAAGRAAAAERARKGCALVLTPHGGEAARLARGARVQAADATDPADPASLAESLAESYGCTVVLKGPDTYIAQTGMPTALMDQGTAALAKAGTGDVLAGVIAGLLAQGLATRDAAVLGATLHGVAGRVAADGLGIVSVTAEDVARALPQAVRLVVEGSR